MSITANAGGGGHAKIVLFSIQFLPRFYFIFYRLNIALFFAILYLFIFSIYLPPSPYYNNEFRRASVTVPPCPASPTSWRLPRSRVYVYNMCVILLWTFHLMCVRVHWLACARLRRRDRRRRGPQPQHHRHHRQPKRIDDGPSHGGLVLVVCSYAAAETDDDEVAASRSVGRRRPPSLPASPWPTRHPSARPFAALYIGRRVTRVAAAMTAATTKRLRRRRWRRRRRRTPFLQTTSYIIIWSAAFPRRRPSTRLLVRRRRTTHNNLHITTNTQSQCCRHRPLSSFPSMAYKL